MEDSLQVQVARYLLEKSILSLRLWTWLDMYYMSSHVSCRVTAPGDAPIRGTYTEKLGFLNIIRYGLVARISRSQTVLTTTQPGPRRPGFNSPCRNLLLFCHADCSRSFVMVDMQEKLFLWLSERLGSRFPAAPRFCALFTQPLCNHTIYSILSIIPSYHIIVIHHDVKIPV